MPVHMSSIIMLNLQSWPDCGRDKESKGMAGRVASIEQEVQLLSEALEAKKQELEKEKVPPPQSSQD